jgi:hypothetical protein
MMAGMTPARLVRPARAALLVSVCGGLAAVLAGCSIGTPEPSAPAITTVTSPDTTTTSPTSSTSSTSPTSPTSEPSPSATPTAVPPFVARVQWVKGSGGRSLHIVPTVSGRAAQGSADDEEAWSEVLRLAPDADQPGMRAQFDCHWTFARLVQPDKASWNIEPWRPVVSESQMVDARCNPGGPESAEG